MTDPNTTGHWGTEVVRRDHDIPVLGYVPRRHDASELLLDAGRWADRVHLVQGERQLTFSEVLVAVDTVAAGFAAAGLAAGDRLLLLAANSPEWVITFWAGLRLGAVVALGNGWWSADEIAHSLDLVQPSLVVADAGRRTLLPARIDPRQIVDVETVRRRVDGPRVACGPRPAVAGPEREDRPAVIVFTAGTTGTPKAVVLAHRSLIANLHNLLVMSRRLPHQIDPDRPQAVSLQSGPLFHIGGVQAILLALLGGNRLVFLPGRFDAGEVLDVIERERVTWWGPVPTMASRVLDHPSLPGRDLTSVRSISMGGAPVQPALVERLRAAFPNAQRGMSTIYGMTETGGTVAAASGATMAEHPQTSGAPLPVVELRIDDASADGEGEIVVRTPGQMVGYWDVGIGGPAGGETLDEDGFVHTGDLGRVVDGLLYVTGRVKDLIIRGGENVAPAHVESVLLHHPAVLAVAVVGLPDADLGEQVGAVVQVPREGPWSQVTHRELAEFTAARLARFEVPTSWWLRTSELPTSESGKPDKRGLQEAWIAGPASEGNR